MNRFSTLTTHSNENTCEPSTLNPNNTFDNTSTFYISNPNEINESDTESISEDSRKIRKKRNTYQKIPDDIRMELLESVKNGETLKSAAKRFKVNYSSAKSILHTYRKEGRILKKSAQERTVKKKVLGPSDTNMATEEAKPEKKKNMKSIENDSKLPSEVAPFSERHASVTTCASLSDETSNVHVPGEFNENFLHLLKMDSHDDNKRNTLRKLSILSQDLAHMNIDGGIKTSKQKNLHFDDFFANHSEFHFPENDYVNHGYHFEEPSSFSYLMDSIKRKASVAEDFFQDPNNFLYSRGMTPVNAENKSFKFDNKGEHYENGEACPLKGFLDIQCLLKEAFRKTSVSYTGNPGFRKNSFDMF